LGYILGYFFTDASGHPGGECEFVSESGDLASPTAPFSFLFLVVPQGDQIGRIFAYWAIVFFGQFFENYRRGTNSWATFFHGKSNALILTKIELGLHFGRFFSQAHLVTLAVRLCINLSFWAAVGLSAKKGDTTLSSASSPRRTFNYFLFKILLTLISLRYIHVIHNMFVRNAN
jgi:hypothetical protein